jgi:signal transduction histidine kinase
MPHSSKDKIGRTLFGAAIKWTAIVIALVFIAFNLGNIFLYRKLDTLLSKKMGENQSFIASAIAEGIRPVYIRSLSADSSSVLAGILRDKLDSFKERGGFTSLNLLDTNGVVIYSSGGGYKKGEYFDYLALDKGAFNSALSGNSHYTELYTSGGNFIRGAYAPVEDELGDVAWVVGIEAGAEYFEALAALRRNMIIFFLISIIVIVSAGAVLFSAALRMGKMEQSLVQSSTLASIGQMAAGVAHDIRNPLAIIRGSAERIRAGKEENKEQLISFILEEVSRMDGVIEGYLSLAKNADKENTPVYLSDLAEDVANRIQDKALKCGVEFVFDKSGDVPVLVPENGIRRCLLNIFMNALDAMQEGGKIEVSSKCADGNISLLIKDSGAGLDKKTKSRIFEPFYTSKPTGTGLGLTISKEIVSGAGGTITVVSEKGNGATFAITFPEYKGIGRS